MAMTDSPQARQVALDVLSKLAEHPLDFGAVIADEKLGWSTCLMAIKPLITQALAQQRRAALIRAIEIAKDRKNLRMVGGSTGNAWDTQAAIVAALEHAAQPREGGDE